jgi:alkaline phosphatase
VKSTKACLQIGIMVLLCVAGQLVWGVPGGIIPQTVLPRAAQEADSDTKQEVSPKYAILMIADGWGYKQIEATNAYTGSVPKYQTWTHYPMATWDLTTQDGNKGVGYDPEKAWKEFIYTGLRFTDSASAATAMYTGSKTDSGNICTSHNDAYRLLNIGEIAKGLRMASGAVSSVQLSHATPGAWYAHNDDRENGYAIADEGLWGLPTLTLRETDESAQTDKYKGHRGPTHPTPDVLIGGGHPGWDDTYVGRAQRDKLASDSGQPGSWTFVERVSGSPDGAARLLAAARDPEVKRLVGLFGGEGGNFEWRMADGSGSNPENPTLADCAEAALDVLGRNPNGFVLMIEGGAIDWANHANNLNLMIGEEIDFDNAVQKVVDWVGSSDNRSSWDNTLVIVTGDHECGYLTAGPRVFPNEPLGEVSDRTLALEKRIVSSGRRASWEDENGNDDIDEGEMVYWAYNSPGHTNQLVPLYVRGAGSERFLGYATGSDPVRGSYIDNTSIFDVITDFITD